MMSLLQRNVLGSESYSSSHPGSHKSNVNGMMSRAVSASNFIFVNDDHLENSYAENYFSLSLPDQIQTIGCGNLPAVTVSRENISMMLNTGDDELQVNLGNDISELLPNVFGDENKYSTDSLSVTDRLNQKDAVEEFRTEL